MDVLGAQILISTWFETKRKSKSLTVTRYLPLSRSAAPDPRASRATALVSLIINDAVFNGSDQSCFEPVPRYIVEVTDVEVLPGYRMDQ